MRSPLMLLLLLTACSAPIPLPLNTLPAESEFLLRDQVQAVVDAQVEGVTVGFVAEIERGPRRVAIVWPAIQASKILDDDVVAFAFERREGTWTYLPDQSNFKAYGEDGVARVDQVLGGREGQRIIRKAGVPQSALADHLARYGTAFKKHLVAGQTAEAILAYERLTSAFGMKLAAHDDALTEMLIGGLFDEPWTVADGVGLVSAEIMSEGNPVKAQLRLERVASGGVVITELK